MNQNLDYAKKAALDSRALRMFNCCYREEEDIRETLTEEGYTEKDIRYIIRKVEDMWDIAAGHY